MGGGSVVCVGEGDNRRVKTFYMLRYASAATTAILLGAL